MVLLFAILFRLVLSFLKMVKIIFFVSYQLLAWYRHWEYKVLAALLILPLMLDFYQHLPESLFYK